MALDRIAEARIQAPASVDGLYQLFAQAGPEYDWPLHRALSCLCLAEVEQAAGSCDAALVAVPGFDSFTVEQREGLSRNHLARRQLLAARCAMQAGAATQAATGYQAALEALGDIGESSSIASVAPAVVVAIETVKGAEQGPLLALLNARDHRRSMVVDACRKAGRAHCLAWPVRDRTARRCPSTAIATCARRLACKALIVKLFTNEQELSLVIP